MTPDLVLEQQDRWARIVQRELQLFLPQFRWEVLPPYIDARFSMRQFRNFGIFRNGFRLSAGQLECDSAMTLLQVALELLNAETRSNSSQVMSDVPDTLASCS